MLRYTLKRVLIALITLWVLITATFFLMKLLPGDPFQNDKVPVQIQERQREYYGLNKPVHMQYLTYMGNLLKGDLGYSLTSVGRSVIDIITDFFPVSAKLGLISIVIFDFIGIAFGIICAQFRGKWPDYVLLVLAVVLVALPSMVVGPLMRYIFGAKLRWLPVAGWGKPAQMVMPVIILGLSAVASYTRSMRASTLTVMGEDYIKTARAKGLGPFKVIMRHELKNSFVPIMSGLGISIVLSGNPSLSSLLIFGRYLVAGNHLLQESLYASLHLLVGKDHTETKLTEVLEERVGPCRTLTLLVGSIRC